MENALKVVEYLNNNPKVEKVHHPSVSEDPVQQALYKKYFPNGGGSIFTFEIKGDEQTAKDFIDQSGAVLSACQCGGCEVARDPSGIHDTFPAVRRRNC